VLRRASYKLQSRSKDKIKQEKKAENNYATPRTVPNSGTVAKSPATIGTSFGIAAQRWRRN
jgi:hypothetical protein